MNKKLKVAFVVSVLCTYIGSHAAVLGANIANEVTTQQIQNVTPTEQQEDTNQKKTEVEAQEKIPEQQEENNIKQDATTVTEENKKVEEKTEIVDSLYQQPNEIPQTKDKTEVGNLNVEINLKLPVESPNLTVSLQKQGKATKEASPEFSQSEDMLYYHFSKLENGIYELTIRGQGYITYTQTVEINNETIELRLTNGHDAQALQTEGEKKIGVIGLGDVTGNSVIDAQDEAQMIKQIESGSYHSKYDFNGDQKIDIIDLSYITLNKQANRKGSLLHLLSTENIAVAQTEDTTVHTENGTLEDILKNNEKYVQLQPQNGKEISESNPVELSFDLTDNNKTSGAITIAPSENVENTIKSGEVIVEDENGNQQVFTIGEQVTKKWFRSVTRSDNRVTVEPDGTIVINLNGQVAIKKVTIKVTQTESNKLADISKVEFLNGMEDRIPAPTMDIPQNVTGIPDSEKFSVTWDRANNVTGYEVSITSSGKTQIHKVDSNYLTVDSFGDQKIKNGTKFEVKVQSINGTWKSGYSNAITVIPEPNKRPDAPDNVKAVGAYKSLKVTWKDMDDTDSYSVYYREYETGEYIQAVTGLTTNSYTIEKLQDQTKYQVYVTGTNKLGTSNPSLVSVATTTNVQPATLPKYKLINTNNGEGKLTNHIKKVTLNNGYMVDSSLDTGKTAYGIVDNSYASYFQIDDWDLGGHYVGEKAPTVEFDDFYTMSYITFAQVQNLDSFTKAHIYYWDKEGKRQSVTPSEVVMKRDSNGRDYTVIKLKEPITTNKINVGIGRPYSNVRKITIAEMNFYYYDSLEQDINNLYADQMHVTLKPEVTAETIENLQTRLNTKDEVSGEYHPEKENLQKEIDTARDILNDKALKQAIQIDTSVTKAKDGHITFSGGLNAWQPLGVVGYEGESIILYVGNPNMKVGANTPLQLIATQYHAESGAWQKTVQNLKVGKNEITIPNINSLDTEKGGSLYINYTGNNANDVYGVRVSGGQEIPVLDLSKVETEAQRKAAVTEYITKLETIVPQLQAKHNELHKGSKTEVDYDYKKQDCILGATEIVLDQMMYSVSSEQILSALKGTTEEKANQLYDSLVAMEDMIDLFYSHKGLSTKAEAGAKNRYPVSRLNIRYQRMFAGAFMYAGGLHIGIEWGSVPGLATSTPVQSDANGKYESGRYFGWGIAHEIGHIINEGAYAVAEITNNYFSVLAQAKDTNDSVRFQYSDVYEKVTSGTIGKASNVFTQLGLYCQLHLAYDHAGYNYKQFDTYQEQFDNLFFARVDTYARDVSKAPKPNGVALTLNGNTDNKLMRLAVAAANKNILPFFEKWGMVPDETTKAYAAQFEKETRAIYYINDEARAYTLENKKPMATGTKVEASLAKEENSNQIKLTFGNNKQEENKEAMLGYEIIRSYQDNDQEISRAVAFVTADQTEYIDTIETVNNRVFTYKIVGYDKYLNQTEEYVLDPIKVSHDGSQDKTDWVIETTLTSKEDTKVDATEDLPCEEQTIQAISKIANNDYSDTYIGNTAAKESEIVVSLGEVTSLVGLKYKAGNGKAIDQYEIQLSQDKTNWETVKQGNFVLDKNNAQTVYFNKENDTWLYTYDASYVKIKIKNQKEVSISEIDLLGQTGDNVELLENGIGKLESDYQYGQNADEFIPAGSIVFTGTYKGNPAYNVVKLWNQDNKLIEGYQIILANVPEKGELGEVSDGTWIYWIEPKDQENMKLPTTVRAELYRVDDAHTNEGERLVSDTYRTIIPDELPNIQIQK